MMIKFTAFVVGIIFALGLGLSGMTQPQKVVGFLDIFGTWDPSLAMVMLGAIGFHGFLYPIITNRRSPILDDQFHIPTSKDITPTLLIGASLFGAGWGLGGFCPGPAITSLASGNRESFVFVGAMLAGMVLFKFSKPLIDKIFD